MAEKMKLIVEGSKSALRKLEKHLLDFRFRID